MAPTLSIVIPWCNRPELGDTLPQNMEAFQSLDAEVLVINCGGDRQKLEPLVSVPGSRRPRVIEISREGFNKCLALNIGAVLSRGRRLFFLDADVVISPAVMAGIVERTDERAFVTIQWVVDSNATGRPTGLAESIQMMELVWTDGERLSFEFYRTRAADQARGGPGLICVLREQFLAVQGMNSKLTSWGWEDMDLIIRLQAMHGMRRVLFGEARHLAHDDSRRNLNGATRQESVSRNMSLCYANYERRKFFGTLRRDVVESRGMTFEHAPSNKDDRARLRSSEDA